MDALLLHEIHARWGAEFGTDAGSEEVRAYGDAAAEHRALRDAAGLLDLSHRSRLVLLGADRQKMLNGQVTNNVKDLQPGQGCYAALVDAKARMVSDLHVFALENEVLLDFEPGLTTTVSARLDQYVVGDDVQIIDAAPHYGLLSIQGPAAPRIVETLSEFPRIPKDPLSFVSARGTDGADWYLMNQPRLGSRGYDLFLPNAVLPALGERLQHATAAAGGRVCGMDAFHLARIEAGIPRFGVDMDARNLAPETGIGDRAISYTKGCYIGQEIIARIRTYGQVAKALRGLRFLSEPADLPPRQTKVFHGGREVGYLTSVVRSPTVGATIALGYVRRECNAPATELTVGSADATLRAVIVALPFVGSQFATGTQET